MSINLLESIQSLFPKDFITKTASILDEKPDYVKNGISGIIPSVLTGLMQKGSTAEGMAMIAQHSSEATDVKFQSSLPKIITGKNYSKYEKLFDSAEALFGEKLSDISHKVSINSGLRETSANWLVRLVTPTALGVLGEHIKKNKLNITDAAHVIANEKDSIINAVPAEYNLTSIFGIGSLQDIGDKFSESVSFHHPAEISAVKDTVESFATEHIPEVTAVKEENIFNPIIAEHNNTEPIKEEVVNKVIVPEHTVAEPKKETQYYQSSAVKHPAFKWKVLSWVLLILFFILLVVLFSILPPMFRIN